jgi:hypothetical protein
MATQLKFGAVCLKEHTLLTTAAMQTIDIDQNGTSSNVVKAYSQVANHTGNEYKIDQDGNDNFGYIDADDDGNDMDVVQNGNNNDAEIYMQGDNNVFSIRTNRG